MNWIILLKINKKIEKKNINYVELHLPVQIHYHWGYGYGNVCKSIRGFLCLGVGKSCILLQFVEETMRDIHDVTIGVEYGTK